MSEAEHSSEHSDQERWPEMLNLRRNSKLPQGKVVYIQSGDPSDFDGYMIAVAGHQLEFSTPQLKYALVMPERRACPDRTENDTNKHVDAFSDEILRVSGTLVRCLCPTARIVRGLLNKRNVIPLKFIFHEPEKYGPLVDKWRERAEDSAISWKAVKDLASFIESPEVGSCFLDLFGSISYLTLLHKRAPSLGKKLKASGMPLCIMAGVMAELEIKTLPLPGRDPRATMNAIYHDEAVSILLSLAKNHEIPLLFVTNNTCNELLKFQDAQDTIDQLHLTGILEDLARAWYGPHLKGKCVPFDWVSFCAMIFHDRFPELVKTEQRVLYIGKGDASVLVLKKPGEEVTSDILFETEEWGLVESVVDVDREAMIGLAQYVSAQTFVRLGEREEDGVVDF